MTAPKVARSGTLRQSDGSQALSGKRSSDNTMPVDLFRRDFDAMLSHLALEQIEQEFGVKTDPAALLTSGTKLGSANPKLIATVADIDAA